ncbi:MAG TPA: lipase family protein [Gemmatales bacterium]|nr:lipase family protein [Gemmatales bacterium]
MSCRLPLGPDQNQYQNALFLAHCSDAVYERGKLSDYKHYDQIAFETVETFEGPNDTQGFVGATSEALVLAFRGTEPDRWQDWCTDFNSKQKIWLACQVHTGFATAHDGVAAKYMELVRKLRTNNQTIYTTGHSLGGALATLAGKVLATGTQEGENLKPALVVTFGAPKVGDNRFVSTYGMPLLRFVHNEDIIPHVSPIGAYNDGGSLLYFKADGKLTFNVNEVSTFTNRLKNAVSAIIAAKGRISDLVPNWIQDHVMERYIERLEAYVKTLGS